MKIKLGSRSSFTLVEVVVSLSILLIIWLAAGSAFIVGKYSASYARHKVQAIYAAQLAIENIRKNVPFANMQDSNTAISIDTRGTPDNAADDFNGRQIIDVSDVAGSGGYYRQVLADIQWNELLFGINRTMHEYCVTYIANEPQVN
ncbi:MAG: type II secretion system protein [Candidatus Omnitrophica bacterium]|nr:type II secretion system protein [Candidatus Omnitrophota bacterium]